MLVLVAEDDNATRLAVRKRLESWGYQVTSAKDGAEAWAILSQPEPPTIAILDWMMPNMDGVEVCKRLNERPDGRFVYVILMTARSQKQDLVTALENGAHSFLSKPVSGDELRSHLIVAQRVVVRMEGALQKPASGRSAELIEAVLQDRLDDLVREGKVFGVLAFQLDRLEWVRKVYGENTATELSHMIVRTMMRAISSPDLIGRSGQNLLMVSGESTVETLWDRANALRSLVECSGLGQGSEVVRTTASVGATLALPYDTPKSVIVRALEQMRRSEQLGGGCVSLDGRG